MTKTIERKAWDLTEQEFENFRIPYKDKRGVHFSLNGKYKIEFKTNSHYGSAGLAHCFVFWVNGKKHRAPFNYAQKLMFELPDDYGYFIVYGLVQQYAKENNKKPAGLNFIERKGTVTFYSDSKGKLFQTLQDHVEPIKVKDGKMAYQHMAWRGGNEVKYNLNGVNGFCVYRKGKLMEDNIWDLNEAYKIALNMKN